MLNKIIKKVLLVFITLTSVIGHAHQAEFSSSLISKTDDGKYILQIASAMSAFEGEVNYLYTQQAYKTAEEFKKLVIDLFLKNVTLTVNGDQVLKFKDPIVLLGHETKVIVEIIGIPKQINELSFTNTMFKDMTHNKMGLMMLVKDFPSEQYILENENQQSIHLELQDQKWVSVGNSIKTMTVLYALSITAVLAILLVYFALKDRKKG